jgi:putative peptidoglycan lipid II flippase
MLAEPILLTVFAHGKFTAFDASQSSLSLIAYASGLVPLMLIKVLAPAFYARQNIKTPVRIGVIAMVANMVFNLMLAPFIGYVGLALATAMSGALNAWLLYQGLVKDNIYQLSTTTLWLLAKAILASALMAALIWHFSPVMSQWQQMSFAAKSKQLGFLLMLAVPSYFALLWLFGVRIKQLKRQTIAETKS